MNLRSIAAMAALLTSGALFQADVALAQTLLTDGTLDLANYAVTSTRQTGTWSYSQVAAGGNPGSALSVSFTLPTGGGIGQTESDSIIFINTSFTYDPAVSGALPGITMSLDEQLQAASLAPNLIEGFFILQGGNFYAYSHPPITLNPGTFATLATVDLVASDFNFQSGTVGAPLHPSFSSGAMQFGFGGGLGASGFWSNVQTTKVLDNFSVAVALAVPEPRTYALLLPGLLGLAVTRRRRPTA